MATFLITPTTSAAEAIDGSFEFGPNGGIWTEFSTNFGTPICSIGVCGNGGGTGPRTGNFWAWLGGATVFELSSVSQTVTIPTGLAELNFFLEIPVVDIVDDDFFQVTIDNQLIFSENSASPQGGTIGYMQHTIDISIFADGASHTLEFLSQTFALGGGVTNFFIDDVSINVAPIPIPPALALIASALLGLGFHRKLA